MEAFLWLSLSRAVVLLFPFRLLLPFIGKQQSETSYSCESKQKICALHVANVISLCSLYTQWNRNCLAQAITGKIMLKYRSVPSTLYLGLKKESTYKLEAHAWLRVGEDIITGGTVAPQYKVISTYGA